MSEAFRRVIEETGLYFGRSTAREIGQLFAKMARGELVSKEASALMIDILKKQQVNDRLPRYLGDGIEIAHKTGDGQPWVANDAGHHVGEGPAHRHRRARRPPSRLGERPARGRRPDCRGRGEALRRLTVDPAGLK